MTEPTFEFACSCGRSRFRATRPALLRAYCHCTICQRYNQADFADVAVFYDQDVRILNDDAVAYAAHKNPPLVMRGTCAHCNGPAAEKLRIPLMPKLMIMPARNISPRKNLPAARMHIFYGDRVADARDTLPKYSGYMRSQTAFSLALGRAMLTGRG